MTFFMMGRDPRMPNYDNEVVAHAWCSTTLPQPEHYAPGQQLFCGSASWNPRGPEFYRGKDIIAARMMATIDVLTMIDVTAYVAREDGHVFAMPKEILLLELGAEPRSLPWKIASKLDIAGRQKRLSDALSRRPTPSEG